MLFILFILVIVLSPTTVYTANYNLNIALYESQNIFIGKLYYLQHTFCLKKNCKHSHVPVSLFFYHMRVECGYGLSITVVIVMFQNLEQCTADKIKIKAKRDSVNIYINLHELD